MASFAILDNRTNAVLEIVEWDGVTSPGPQRAIDTTMHELPDGVTPAVGDVWNGTVFVTPDVAAEAEAEPAAEEEPHRKRGRKSESD